MPFLRVREVPAIPHHMRLQGLVELYTSPRQHRVELLVRMAALVDHGLVDPKGPLEAPHRRPSNMNPSYLQVVCKQMSKWEVYQPHDCSFLSHSLLVFVASIPISFEIISSKNMRYHFCCE